jgi:putative ATP-binding cassette transporter
VAYTGVTLESPDNAHLLVENLNLEILPGERWLVTCADDTTKVALFRATAGVWPCGGGMIQRPGLDEILFLPERPYLPPGTLREVLLRTGAEDRVPDAVIMDVLAKLDADVVARAGGLDKEQDWDDMLSIGEQHMLSIARILLAKPEFVYLDRPGSALSRAQIAKALDLIKEQGIGVVVLAKDGESRLRYDGHLDILTGGKWEVRREEAAGEADFVDDLSC